jgi:hypothetical protein
MSKHMRWITLACLPACTIGQSATLYGEMSVAPTAKRPDAVDVVAVFSPERADHAAVGTTVYGSFPSAFTLAIDPLPIGVFEDDKGYRIAAGTVWIAKPGVSGSRDDGFGEGELIQMTGYSLAYLADDPGTKQPYGVADMEVGWNLLHRIAPSCEDRISFPGGGYAWPAKYERLPIETSLGVEILPPLTAAPWDPPHNCP